MGMGDEKIPYTPSYAPVRDDVNGKMFSSVCVRSCPHPAVIKKYGVGGKANVSIYTCRRCKYIVVFQHFGGAGCGYCRKQ